MKAKNFRKRNIVEAVGEDDDSSDHENNRLEEVKFLQRQREKKSGIPALPTLLTSSTATASTNGSSSGGLVRKVVDTNEGDGEKDDLVLQDTFAQETAVMVEDPNMLRYVEQELARKRGKNIDVENQVGNDVKHAEDELYKIPEHLKVKRRSSGESSTQWTTGIAEVQLPIEYKLRNIEETEAAKKLLQEKRLDGRAKADVIAASSFSANFFTRGKDSNDELRKEHAELPKDKGVKDGRLESRHPDSVPDAANRRQAATDEFMLERFRKRERQRVMRR